jgi:adenylate cyclase
MKSKVRPRWIWLLALLPVLVSVSLQMLETGPQQVLRNNLFDQYQRWHPRIYVDVPVRIIDIDDESLERFGQWPWPRTRIAELVDRLTLAGVAAIGFDVLFAEPDRTSPRAAADLWKLGGRLRGDLIALPDHDQVLANSLRKADAVIGFALDRSQPAAAKNPPLRLPLKKANFVNLGEVQTNWLHSFTGSVASLQQLEVAAKGNGALTYVPDADGVVRRVPLVLQLAGQPVPTLASELLRVAQNSQIITLRSAGHINGFLAENDNGGLGEIRIGELVIPTTANGELWVHYTPRRPERSLPAWKIFAGEIPSESLKGNILLVGSSAQGLMDQRFNPFGLIPGVESNAQALEQILTGNFLERPSWAFGTEIAVLLFAGLGIGLLALHTRAIVAVAVCGTILTVILGGAWYAFVAHRLLIDVSLPTLGILFTFVICSLSHHLFSEREQRRIKEAFSRYVSPNRVAYVVDNPEAMALGGRLQECSFIFTDLEGFTTLMERIDPAEAVALINGYLDEMIAIAFRFEGTLDRIVGDAVAIMFSAPVTQLDHRARAFACALQMDAFANSYSKNLQEKGIVFGKTRIGIHAGEVIVGNFGGKNIFDYRALGDPINTASRLESVNKTLGTRMCVSETILAGCPDAQVRPVGRLVLKGKTQPLGVFEPVTEGMDATLADRSEYEAAYESLRYEKPDALERFIRLAEAYPDDHLIALHCRRLQAGERGDLIVMANK